MKKILKFLGTAIVMIILCLVGAACGFLISIAMFSGILNPFEAVLLLVGIIVAFYLSTILHEAGHLIFGLISGYKFSSFRIASFMWIKQDGKINFRRLSIAGTGGQCLMIPPEVKEGKIPVILYNLGGVIVNILLTAIFALGYCLVKTNFLLSIVLLFGAAASIILALTNGLPLNIGGISNDGLNAIHLSRNPGAAVAFRNQLLMNAAQANGVRISAMPDEWFTLPDGADMKNVHNASIAVFAESRTLDRLDTESAEIEIEQLLNSDYNVIGLHKNLLKCDLVFARLVNHGREAEISSILTLEQLKFMKSMSTYPSVMRTEYAISLIRDKDEKKAEKIKNDFEKMARKYPYPTDIAADRSLMDLALKTYEKEI